MTRPLFCLAAISLALTACAATDSAPLDRNMSDSKTTDATMTDRASVTPGGVRVSTISGEVGYRERILPPADSRVIVKLLDISRADAPSVELTRQEIPLADRAVPVSYKISVNDAAFEASHRYAIRAEIRNSADALLWTSDTVNPVDPAAPMQTLPMITMVKVAAPASE